MHAIVDAATADRRPHSVLSRLLSPRIRGRLMAGFGAVTAVLAVAVGATIVEVRGVSTRTERMIDLRMSVALLSTEMIGNLYSTLATLRGYLLTGDPNGKNDRAAM